jgi:AcrR family transcriptional regulator
MTPRTPRPNTKREQRRASIERILEAALSRILARGYHSTTVDDIAREAGMTKGAVYFYFENKSALFMALLDEIESLIMDGLIARLSEVGSSPVDQLVAAIHGQGILAAERSRHLIVFTIALVEFTGANDPIEHRLQQIYRRLYETIEDIVVRGQERGDFHPSLRPRELASIVLALEHGTLLEWYFRSSEINGGELVRTARTLLLEGILHEPARAAVKTRKPRAAPPKG